jgi:hypothetical protein
MEVKVTLSDKLGTFQFEGSSEDLRWIWHDICRIREEEQYRKERRGLFRWIQQLTRNLRDLAHARKLVKEGLT